MARRKHLAHLDQVREKIKTSQLINRLNGFALGEKDAVSGQPIVMSAAQVKAATTLLKKTVPDLQIVDGSIDLHHHTHEEQLAELD